MLHKTKGIVLRTVKYGDSSLVVTAFTSDFGVQTYMVKGVRSSSAKGNKAAYFQSGTLLDLVVYMQPNKNMQHVREYQPLCVYNSLHSDVYKNCILLFSVELIFRLLPEHAQLPELYSFAEGYLQMLDNLSQAKTANLPLYFMLNVAALLGYELKGVYSEHTPFLDMQEGGFSENTPVVMPFTSDADARALDRLRACRAYEEVIEIPMTGEMRWRLMDWFVAFLQQHTQHMGNIRSLPVLRAVLH